MAGEWAATAAFSSPTAYVPLNGTYVEPGFTVTVGGQAVSDPSVTATTVDTAVAGVQRVVYVVTHEGVQEMAVRFVVVGAPSFPISYMSPTAMRAGPWKVGQHAILGRGAGSGTLFLSQTVLQKLADDVMSVNFNGVPSALATGGLPAGGGWTVELVDYGMDAARTSTNAGGGHTHAKITGFLGYSSGEHGWDVQTRVPGGDRFAEDAGSSGSPLQYALFALDAPLIEDDDVGSYTSTGQVMWMAQDSRHARPASIWLVRHPCRCPTTAAPTRFRTQGPPRPTA